MKRNRKLTAMFLCILMSASLLSGCAEKPETDKVTPPDGATPTPTESKYKKELVIALSEEFTTLDPQATTADPNQIVQDCVMDLLTDTDLTKMVNHGELVEKWEMIEPDLWEFTLKSNVTFHDGTILNVDDVLFTFERAAKQPTTSVYMSQIAETTKIDDLTFRCKLVNPNVDFNFTIAANGLAILSKEAFETMPEDEAVVIGTGPWKFDTFTAGDSVSLVRFEGSTLYPVPKTERLTFRFIPEASARLIALETGEVDICLGPSTNDYTRITENKDLELLQVTGRGQQYLGFNCTNKKSPTSDPKFRKAISYAINKDDIVAVAFGGYATVSTSIMCRGMWGYADLEGTPYDPAKAKELLAELGYADGLNINIVTSNSQQRTDMATVIQAQLAEVGITANVELMQAAAFTEKLQQDNTVELFVLSWTPGMNADYMFRNPLYSTGGKNFSHNIDAKADDLIDRASQESDTDKRLAMYKELQEYLTYDIVPWVPMCQAMSTIAIRAGVEGVQVHPAGVHVFKFVQTLEQ